MGAQRQFDQYGYTLQKRAIWLWAEIAVPTGTTPVLQRWQYPALGNAAGVGAGQGGYVNAATSGGSVGQFGKYAQGAEGVFSVARTGAGLWTITLQDPYIRCMNAIGTMATSSANIVPNIICITEDRAKSNFTASNQSTIGLQLLSSTGTRADPTADSSTLIHVTLELNDSSEQ